MNISGSVFEVFETDDELGYSWQNNDSMEPNHTTVRKRGSL
jgi:hypothetical protein